MTTKAKTKKEIVEQPKIRKQKQKINWDWLENKRVKKCQCEKMRQKIGNRTHLDLNVKLHYFEIKITEVETL